jgi:hypothetical protein
MGISIADFEYMTPYELSLYAECYHHKIVNEREERITLVWLGEYYHRIKKLPPLTDEIRKLMGKPKRAMTDEEMLKMAEVLNAQFGGNVINKGRE